jgi:hypothetical protein
VHDDDEARLFVRAIHADVTFRAAKPPHWLRIARPIARSAKHIPNGSEPNVRDFTTSNVSVGAAGLCRAES